MAKTTTPQPLPLWQRLQDCCEHFNGLRNETCEAGVKYLDVRDTSQSPYAFPCLKREEDPTSTVTCDKAEFLTDEQAQQRADEIYARARARMQRQAEGFCGRCDRKVERTRKIGRCLYNEPCRCRMGQA